MKPEFDLSQLLPKHPQGAVEMLEASLEQVDIEVWHEQCEELDKQLEKQLY